MYGTHVLLHISVFLFFWAISDFFYTVYPPFGLITRYTLVAAAMVYILLSISPFIFINSPYNTPITPPLRAAGIILRIVIRSPKLVVQWYRSKPESISLTGLSYYSGIHFDREHLYSIKAEERAEELELYAMEWLFTENDFSDNDMDKFLEGLPGYMSSSQTKPGQLDRYLTADYLLNRVKDHFMTCATSVELSDDASIARAYSCVKALLRIFIYNRQCMEKSPNKVDKLEELQSQKKYIQTLMDDFQALCGADDPLIALRASCIRALANQGLLSQLIQPESKAIRNLPFPIARIPIYTFFFPKDNTSILRRLDDGHTLRDEEMKTLWESFLQDGPLANLTILAKAIRDREDAPPSSLSFCWKALGILLTQLGTIHSKELTYAQKDFDTLHENIRAYVHDDERGFRIRPLLDILDIVARGRRLSIVLSGHPKYYNRADVAFGKEYFRNGDLLEAFAHCLPHFISKHSSEECMDFMEKVVRHDDLWTSLQVNLWNTERSDSPTPDKLRVFEDCCVVLDLAFSVLKDSEKMDWRAPEFGSLLQHFESFITHCFKGAIMGRGTSFRVSIIKARFCNGLLGQFKSDLEREGALSFRSQWDVASLASLINTLGLHDKKDAEFWNSYIDGGHIGAKFTTKALEAIDMATRDGPLLIFCQLGLLAASAVPLDQSGLDLKDIEKVWTLQKEAIKNTRLPLTGASVKVWESLDQLRDKVNDLCGKYTGNDRKNLQSLLRIIDDVRNLSLFDADGPIKCEPAEEQSSKTSAAANSSSSSESRHKRSSFASESTAFSGGPSIGTSTGEGEDGFGRARPLLIPGSFIDLRPERSVDKILEDDRKTYVRSDSPQSCDSGSHGLPSLHPNPGVKFMERSIAPSPFAIRPVIPYFPMEDARPRRTYPSTRRAETDPGFNATRPSFGVSTSVTLASRRDMPTEFLDSAIGSPLGSPDLSDEGQSGAESSSPPSRR